MTQPNLTQTEFKLAHRLIDDLDLARRTETNVAEPMDEKAIVDYVHRNYIEQGQDIDRTMIQQLLQTRLKEQLPAVPVNTSKLDALMKKQQDHIRFSTQQLRQKQFYTNARFAELLAGPEKVPAKAQSSSQKLWRLCRKLIFPCCLLAVVFISWRLAALMLLLGFFCIPLFSSTTPKRKNKETVPFYIANGLKHFLDQRLGHPTLLLAYKELTLGSELKSFLPEMDSLQHSFLSHQTRSLFPNKKYSLFTLSVELLTPEHEKQIRFKSELSEAILNEWKESGQPIRLLDIYFLQHLDHVVTKHQNQSNFLAS